MFHVEHAPVEEPAALARPPFHQGVDAGVNGMHGKQRCQLRHTCRWLAVNFLLEASGAISDAKSSGAALRDDLAEDRKPIAPVLDETPDLSRAKRSPAAQNENSFEQAGFTRAIGPKEVITAWIQLELDIA